MKALILSDIHANIYALRAIEKVETWDAGILLRRFDGLWPFPDGGHSMDEGA